MNYTKYLSEESNIPKESVTTAFEQKAKLYNKAVIYFHMDLDGVASAIAMKYYLTSIGTKTINAFPIQYSQDLYKTPKYSKPGVLNVMVDFSKSKINSKIWVDHHIHDDDEYLPDDTMKVDLEGAKSAAEKINTYIQQPSNDTEILDLDVPNKFSDKDIEIISMIDSAGFAEEDWTPNEVSKVLYDESMAGERSKEQLKGIAANGILNVYKNKPDFLSDLVMECQPSLSHIYDYAIEWASKFYKMKYAQAVRRAIKMHIEPDSEEFFKKFSWLIPPTPEQAQAERDKRSTNIKKGNIGKGAYDRYQGIKDEDYILKQFPGIGMIQISKNAFKKIPENLKESKSEFTSPNLDLEILCNNVLDKFKNAMLSETISIYDIKKFAETEFKDVLAFEKAVNDENSEEIERMLDEIYGFNTERADMRKRRFGLLQDNGEAERERKPKRKPTNLYKILTQYYGNEFDENKEWVLKGLKREVFNPKLRNGTIINNIDKLISDIENVKSAKEVPSVFGEVNLYYPDIFGLVGSDIMPYSPDKMINDEAFTFGNKNIIPSKNALLFLKILIDKYPLESLERKKPDWKVFSFADIRKLSSLGVDDHNSLNKMKEFTAKQSIEWLKKLKMKKYYWVINSSGGHKGIYNISGLDIFGYGKNKMYNAIIKELLDQLDQKGIDRSKILMSENKEFTYETKEEADKRRGDAI